MQKFELKVKSRELTGKKTAQLRKKGFLPAVMYGPETEPKNIMVEQSVFEKVYNKAGNNAVVHLNLDEGKEDYDVLIYDVAYDPITDFIIHVDFYCFRSGHKLNTTIPFVFVGQAKPVKEQGAVLIKPMEELEVRCLPKDLVNEIEIDVSKIQTLDDVIKVSDIKMPEGMEAISGADDIIALVTMVREEAEAEGPAAELPAEEKKEEGKEEKEAENEKKQ
jgi:large subunit ribosomal protein L25